MQKEVAIRAEKRPFFWLRNTASPRRHGYPSCKGRLARKKQPEAEPCMTPARGKQKEHTEQIPLLFFAARGFVLSHANRAHSER